MSSRKPSSQSSRATRPQSRSSATKDTATNKPKSASASSSVQKAKSSKSASWEIPSGQFNGARPKEQSSSSALVPRKHPGPVSKGRGSSNGERSLIVPQGYKVRPVIPAEKAELVSVARAMNREEFGPRLQKLFDPETEAATEAIQTGVYIGWRCPQFTWDCIRVGRLSRCFCGHILQEHASYNGHSVRVPCRQSRCGCKAFAFIPGRPEDIGEFWFQRRRDFDPTKWRAKCRCKHTHEEHQCAGYRSCKRCSCGAFNSNFLCAACDKHWEEHETVFETESHRHQNNIPYGEAYLPFAEMPELRNMALTGVDDNPGIYQALMDGRGPIPRSRAIDQNTPVKPPTKKSTFKPVWD
ncbi:LOW QUALITY PROTEIN: protein FAM221B-like [Amphiura filiformis]|uniref:LOW QUALITY PROTEIN: protein FAM221B-like n=1 Tax=Amphiura filiformis TaxID=82378 RepID=UPI003B228E6D